MHRRITALTATTFAALLLTACAASTSPTTSTSGASVTPSASESARPPFQTTTRGPITPTGSATPGDTSGLSDARWDAILSDLTARGVTATPTLVSVEEVEFSDGSLGCASPGQSYTQALIDGQRVMVDAGGTTYDYRFGGTDVPKLCTR